MFCLKLEMQINNVQVKCWCFTSKTPPNDVNSHRLCTKSELKIVLYYSRISEALFFLHVLGMCLKVWNVCLLRLLKQIKWITQEIEVIGNQDNISREYVHLNIRANCIMFKLFWERTVCYFTNSENMSVISNNSYEKIDIYNQFFVTYC
jgi:hypothetical protein